MRRGIGLHLEPLSSPSFRSLLASKFATRLATDSLMYALLIHVVEETGSARDSTLFVLAIAIPVVLFGLIGGVVAEASALRPLLLAGHVTRVAVVGGLLLFGSSIWWVFGFVFAFSTVGQFVGPAEASALPRLVPPEERPAAHALVASVIMVGSLLGGVAIGPIVLKLLDWRAVLPLSLAVHALSAVLSLGVRLPDAPRARRARRPGASAVLLHGWRSLRASPDALLAFGYLTIAGVLARVLVALAPYYSRDVLGISPENTVYIAIPALVGSVVALAATPAIS